MTAEARASCRRQIHRSLVEIARIVARFDHEKRFAAPLAIIELHAARIAPWTSRSNAGVGEAAATGHGLWMRFMAVATWATPLSLAARISPRASRSNQQSLSEAATTTTRVEAVATWQ